MISKVDAVERLEEEYKSWEKIHPEGFKAKPSEDNGVVNYLLWHCEIPGKKKTAWEGGVYKLRLEFTVDYPYQPPRCVFHPPIFHPNVFLSGKVSLSLLEKNWVATTTVKEILLGIQCLLDEPNFQDPAQVEAYAIHSQGKHLYEERVREQAKRLILT